MKRLTTVLSVYIILSTLFHTAHAQLVVTLESLMKGCDLDELQSFVNKVPVSKDSSIRAYWYPFRQTTKTGWSGSLVVEESRPDPEKEYLSYVNSYRLDIISIGKVIVYSRLFHQYFATDTSLDFTYRIVSTKMNQTGLSTFKNSFLQEYGKKVTLSALFTDSIYYGDTCLSNDMKTTERKQVDQFISQKDRKGLYRLLQSPVTEIQFYGISGFYALQQQGLRLLEKEMMLIRFILQKKGTLKTCGRHHFKFLKDIEEVAAGFRF